MKHLYGGKITNEIKVKFLDWIYYRCVDCDFSCYVTEEARNHVTNTNHEIFIYILK